MRDLLGEDSPALTLQTPGTKPRQFIHEDVLAVDAPALVQYRIAAETVGKWASERDWLGCSDEPCVRQRLDDFTSRAFRRPLAPGELEQLWTLYELGRADGPDHGFAHVVEAVLQSPSFLYRTDLGDLPEATDAIIELTPYELAVEVSFLLHDSIPDAALWRAASDGSLRDPAVLAQHVDRLLETPRARDHLVDVILDWLDVPRVLAITKDETVFPELTPALRTSMYLETERFVEDVLWERGGSLHELLTSSSTYVDAQLATLYEVEAAEALAPVRLDPKQRGGILTHASILSILASAQRESIISRGMFVHHKFLCTEDPGRPPFAAIAEEAEFASRLSESQFADYRAEHVYCSGCHKTIDPPGRAMHHYDGLGRWRATDSIDVPIDADASISIDGATVHVSNAIELGRALADSDDVAGCVVDQLAHHALGRAVTDPAIRGYLHRRFDRTGRDLVDVFRAIATLPGFRLRKGSP